MDINLNKTLRYRHALIKSEHKYTQINMSAQCNEFQPEHAQL